MQGFERAQAEYEAKLNNPYDYYGLDEQEELREYEERMERLAEQEMDDFLYH